MKLLLKKSETDVIIHVFIQDSSSATGEGLTGLVHNSASLTAYYVKPGGTLTALTLETIATLGTYAAPTSSAHARFKLVHDTNVPGMYEIHLHTDTLATNDYITIMLKGAADMVPLLIEIQLTDLDLNTVLTDASIADAVWDEPLTGSNHNDPTSAGRQLRELSSVAIRQETAQAGTASTITLDAGASAEDCIFDRNRISIVEGTGAGQSAIIILYIGATRVAIMDRPWAVIPDNTSVFQILAGSSETDCLDHGYAQAGAVGSITLKSDSSAINDFYKDCEVMITAGTGAEQQRLVTGYTGASQLATVSPNWKTAPDNTSIYHIKYAARKVADSLGATSKAQVNAECDTAISDAGLESNLGPGAILWPITVNDGDGNPIDNVAVWVSTDISGSNVVAGTRYTNASGVVSFMLDETDYYIWREKSGWNFTNPVPFTVTS